MKRKGKLGRKMTKLSHVYKNINQKNTSSSEKLVSVEKPVLQQAENIKVPKPDIDKAIPDLVAIALEVRKIRKKLDKLQEQNPSPENFAGFNFSLDKINETLNKNKIVLTDYAWHKYIEWMNTIEIVSVERDPAISHSMIIDTIAPLVELDWKIYSRSKVIVLFP